ncbi:MAG: hypothetical protein JOZ99_08165 [Actinobacteria bacterium]|nr:hypothetical protein [Actinomycetota bacterium]
MVATRRSAASTRTRGTRVLAPPVVLVVCFAAIAAAITGFAPVADADAATFDGSTNVDVGTDPSGAHVELDRDFSWVERGKNHSTGGASGAGCRRRWVSALVMLGSPDPIPPQTGLPPIFVPAPPTPGAELYYVFCGDAYVGMLWAVPSQFNGGNLAASIRSLAERLVQDLPYPRIGVGISPEERGLTGLESWFWVTGSNGAALVDTVRGLGHTVTVEARATEATWDFGDGTSSVSGLGRPYPERSDVTHVYERRSGRDGYASSVAFRFDARYRVDGGEWQTLDPVERVAQRTYPVDEVRAQLLPSS